MDATMFDRMNVQSQDVSSDEKPKRSVRFEESRNKVATFKGTEKRHVSPKRAPGSRRQKRFLDKMELLEIALSDSEGEEFEIEVEYKVEFRSPFSVLFNDQKVKSAWEPFVSTTEAQQTNMLSKICPPEENRGESKLSADPTSPERCWHQVTRVSRKTLRQLKGNSLLREVDDVLVEALTSKSKRGVVIRFDDAYECIIAHCIAPYYSAELVSEENSDESFTTTVYPRRNIPFPSQSLSDYLRPRHKRAQRKGASTKERPTSTDM